MNASRANSYRAVLRHDAFRWLWVAGFLSRAGDAISQIAMPLLVYDRTGSPGLLGAIFVIQTAPRVILAPIAGLLADRLDRRKMMIRTAWLRAAAVAVIPFASEVWQIALLAVIVSIGMVLSLPAELSTLPATVPSEHLVPALSLTQVTSSIMRIIGPAAGAALIGSIGMGAAFWTEAACFMAAGICLGPLRIPESADANKESVPLLANAKSEIMEGLRVVWQTPIVRGVTATECMWALIGAATSIAGLVYVEQNLDLGERTELVYGFLSASLATGALTGALLASTVERRISRPAMLAAGYLGPLLVLPVLFEPPVPVLYGCWFLFGIADAFAVIAMQAYLAESVSSDMRGRVYATWNGLITLSWLVCYGTVGWITDHIGAAWTIASAGVIVGVGGPLLLILTNALAAVRAPKTVIASSEGA